MFFRYNNKIYKIAWRKRVVKRKAGRKAEYQKYKQRALELAQQRISHFNRAYGFTVNSIRIKNQKTRWGSCSKKGNLNFNYKIALLPERLADYVIVHELCHLGEFNHSKKFWDLVKKTIPDYKRIKEEFKKAPR
jgi:predicted metal-dependent hydrolase